MKKFIAAILALSMTVTVFCACVVPENGNDDGNGGNSGITQPEPKDRKSVV